MQFTLTDFIHDNSIEDGDRKNLDEIDFKTRLE